MRDPEWGEPATQRRFAAFMYGLGGAMCGLSLVLPDPDPSDHPWLLAMAIALGLGVAAILLLRPSRVLARTANVVAVLAISTLVAVAVPLGGVPYFYAWPVLFAALLLPRGDLILACVLMVVSFGGALFGVAGPAEGGVVVFVAASASAIGVGVVVRVVRGQRNAVVVALRRAATTDVLTDLPNRRAFEAELDRARGRADARRPLTLVILDLDRFKQINDRHGHAVGDQSLVVFARALRECVPQAFAARIGGEEFALVLEDATADEAQHALDLLDRRLLESDPVLPPTVELSACAGVVTTTGGVGRDALLGAADEALYLAKAEGRGATVVAQRHGERPRAVEAA